MSEGGLDNVLVAQVVLRHQLNVRRRELLVVTIEPIQGVVVAFVAGERASVEAIDSESSSVRANA